MKVAYVNQWFPPAGEGLTVWLAEALRDQGLDVAVVAGVPNYPTGVVPPGFRASRAVRINVKGFPAQICPLYPSHDASAVGRFLNYGSFAASAAWVARGPLAQADVTLVYSSPATAALPALAARLTAGTPYVLLIQDLWPDSVFATGFLTEGLARRTAERGLDAMCSAFYRHASHIAVITPGMRDTLIDRGVPADKVSVVYNWADEAVYRPVEPRGVLRGWLGIPSCDTVLMYAGNHGYAQGLSAWIDAMAMVRDLGDVHLVLVGQGPVKDQLQVQAGATGLANVHFLDQVPPDRIAPLAADADAMVISLADRTLFGITLPGKTQSSLALGKAILASGAGDLRSVVQDSGAGWVAAPESPAAIAEMIRAARAEGRDALAKRGWDGLQYYRSTMAAGIGGASLAAILRTAAVAPGHDRP